MFKKNSYALAFVLMLAACTPQQSTFTTVMPGANAQSPYAGTKVVNRTAQVGQTIQVGNQIAVNPDCTPDDLGSIRITQEPSHGKAQIVKRDAYPYYPAGNPRASCNQTKTPSIAVDYTPAPGFTGTDLMSVELFTHNGGDSGEIKVLITVK